MYERTYNTKVLSQKAPPEKKRRRRFPMRRFLKIAGGVVALAALVFLMQWKRLRVQSIDVVGASVTDPEDVRLFINSQIEGKILYLFPKSSMLLVPTASLTKWTARAFPRFESVDVRRKGVRELLVTVKEYQGEYLWCESEASCYFMAGNGVVFAEAPFFSGDAYVKLFFGEKKELPFSPLTGEQLELIELALDRLPSISIQPLVLRRVSEHQMDIVFSRYGEQTLLLIDPTRDIEKTLEDLATALAADPLKREFRDESKTLEYLDARFANKVIYKFK